jgi:hypothetical protein
LKKKKKDLHEEDVGKKLQSLLSQNSHQNLNNLDDDEIDQLIQDSEYIQKWKQIPKARREKLTKKQLLKMFKESTMADTIQVSYQQEKK